MLLATSLQFSNDPTALAEWFLASLALIAIVTAIYVFVLNKSPPPQGETVLKTELQVAQPPQVTDAAPLIQKAGEALKSNDLKTAVEDSVQAVSVLLGNVLASSSGQQISSASISDLAYLVQTRAKSAPQIAQPVYQLNSLRLRAIPGQPVDSKEATWAVSFAQWLAQSVQSDEIKL